MERFSSRSLLLAYVITLQFVISLTFQTTSPSTRMTKRPVSEKMFAAAMRNDTSTVKKCIELHDVSPAFTSPFGQTVAHIAAKRGNMELLKYLLAKDPNLATLMDGWDQTVLHLAVESGSLEMVKFLVDQYHVDVEEKSNEDFGDPPIFAAAELGHLEIFKYLVEEKNVDVNVKNGLEQPPAFTAAGHARLNIVKYIVEVCKANVTIKDSLGGNILYKSARNGDISVPKYLLDEVKLQININQKDYFGETILHRAARINHGKFIKYFVGEKGADVNIPDNQGRTPLHLAAALNNLNIIKYLVTHGADIHARDHTEQTAAQTAQAANVIQYLEKAAKKRIRRNVPDTFNPSALPSNEIAARLIARTGIDGSFLTAEHPEFDMNHVDSILTLANTFVGARLRRDLSEERKLSTPAEFLRSRIDTVAVDALHHVKED